MFEVKKILVPDIGNFKDVSVIEVLVKAGDKINVEDSLITLETEKAALDVPSTHAGVVKEILVKAGDKVSQGAVILLLESSEVQVLPLPAATPIPAALATPIDFPLTTAAHASPGIRHFAHELGVDLVKVKGSGEKGRVTKEDVQNFVKSELAQKSRSLAPAEMPVMDFSLFGPIETRQLSRIQKISGANLHRNWLSIPHVTQFDEADISEMEAFRKQLNRKYAGQGIKITLLAFMLKTVVAALQKYPEFNASLDAGGENLVLKRYFHIGVAVDTPHGLVVPILRDVDRKGIVQLAAELDAVSARARDGRLAVADMQGGSFTISSLGGIGGVAFTPVINAPEVAILGVSRSSMKQVYRDGEFLPRLMLPLSLSYDHRVIDGANAARFTVYLAQMLADIRRLVL